MTPSRTSISPCRRISSFPSAVEYFESGRVSEYVVISTVDGIFIRLFFVSVITYYITTTESLQSDKGIINIDFSCQETSEEKLKILLSKQGG